MPTRAPSRQIDVQVFPAYRTLVKAGWLRQVARAALDVADPSGEDGLSLVIADDETLHDLNARFRGLDEVTDVLSFGATGEGQAPDEIFGFPDDPGSSPSLGEVILSHPLAVRQAAEHGWAPEREVALLVVHGVFHLLGHEHAEQGEEAEMKRMEGEALTRVFPGEISGAVR